MWGITLWRGDRLCVWWVSDGGGGGGGSGGRGGGAMWVEVWRGASCVVVCVRKGESLGMKREK